MQSGQDGCECYWTWYKGLDGQIVESVVSLPISCQLLCTVAVKSWPISEKGVAMRKMLISVIGICWDDR